MNGDFILSNSGHGVEVVSPGLVLTAANPDIAVLIQNCTITENTSDGIRLSGGGSHQLLGNTVADNKADGVRIADGSGFNTLKTNTITGNHAAGVWLEPGGLGNTIGLSGYGNTVSDNKADGVHAEIGDLNGYALDLTVAGNTIESNDGDGLELVTDTVLTAADPNYAATVTLNQINGNGLHGVRVRKGGSHQFANNGVVGNESDGYHLETYTAFNTVSSGTASGNGGDGVRFDGPGPGNTLSGVAVVGNEGHGVYVDIGDPGAALALTVSGNTVQSNAGDGLALVATGVTLSSPGSYYAASVTGNTLWGNGWATTGAGLRAVGGGGHTLVGNTVEQNTGHGVLLDGASFNRLQAGNAVLLNGGDGLAVVGGVGNTSRQTTYSGNGGLGIDLGDDGVTTAGVPVLTSAYLPHPYSTVNLGGYLTAAPNATYVIEFFGNPVADPSGYGEGAEYLGEVTVTTDGSGQAPIAATVPAGSTGPYPEFAATATRTGAADPGDDRTSEFSNNLIGSLGPPPGPGGIGGP